MDSNELKACAERLAELIEKVPNDKREIVAAQVFGTINGVVLAHTIDTQEKQSA